MKSAIYIFPLVALLPLFCGAQTKRLAVYDFDYSAVKGDVVQTFGADRPVGAQVANRIISKLVSSGRVQFDVIDRNQIDNIMKEQNLKFSDRFDPRDAPKLGKLLNVDAIVTGSIEAISAEVQKSRLGFGGLGLGKNEAIANVQVSVRVISTETGRIFLADTANIKESHSLGTGATIKGQGGDNANNASHPGAIPATAGLQKAADDLAGKIIAKAEELPSRSGRAAESKMPAPPVTQAVPPSTPAPDPSTRTTARLADAVTLKIGRVEGAKVYITGGENAGLKVNDYLEVRRVTGSMKDDQGNSIETDEKVGEIVVTDVQDRFSIAKEVPGTGSPMVGDKLKHTKATPGRRSALPRSGVQTAKVLDGLPAPVQGGK